MRKGQINMSLLTNALLCVNKACSTKFVNINCQSLEIIYILKKYKQSFEPSSFLFSFFHWLPFDFRQMLNCNRMRKPYNWFHLWKFSFFRKRHILICTGFPGGSVSKRICLQCKRLPAMQETWIRFLGREDFLEKEMATHSSILVWEIPQTEEPGRQQTVGLQDSDTTQ